MENRNFASRHIGPRSAEVTAMLKVLSLSSRKELIQKTVPTSILTDRPLDLPRAASEEEILAELKAFGKLNQVYRSFIGMGYYGTITPPVILRNIMENPGWYTQYTPYQAEIAQGRLEALLNFQTMVCDLTGLAIANASLLDEATAAAEAMAMCLAVSSVAKSSSAPLFFVSNQCHAQTIAVVQTRAEHLGVKVIVEDEGGFDFTAQPPFGILLQYPNTLGAITDYKLFVEKRKNEGSKVVFVSDLLALTLLTSPGELGADIVVGSTQRFGVPMGYGGPHAAFLSTQEAYKRQMPGRIVGVSKDAEGCPAIRLALQTREQHIRRDKATSNICTAQVLLAVMASMYAVYHGPDGLKEIAARVHRYASALATALRDLGYQVPKSGFFDTVYAECTDEAAARTLRTATENAQMNFRWVGVKAFTISLDEKTNDEEFATLLKVLATSAKGKLTIAAADYVTKAASTIPADLQRRSTFLTHPVFNSYHSETEMLRYMRKLELRDLSLAHSMIPLGSCTMKLNATAEMIPVTWDEYSQIHPFVPVAQAKGYRELTSRLEKMLGEITGFDAVSLQPNAGSQGEYAGLLVIKKYFETKGERDRNICLIPQSAHGTNPASAAMAGMKVVVVQCDTQGNIDLTDLRAKAEQHGKHVAALMVTYPSTHGVFEEEIKEICAIVHQQGGQVYMDGANMNAQVGVCRPGEIGADVCHLNLHKTFSIPHGGGGPGMGPIGVKKHLAAYLPTHPVVAVGDAAHGVGAISAAPWGSASILPISYSYIRMMGGKGLLDATEIAILNANYMAHRLDAHYPVLYRGKRGFVAHECIIDLRPLKATSGVEVEDVAKRLMDYGFHAPTVSFPVPGTMMIEPTESESKAEIDRFCDAMIAIRAEIAEIEAGKADRQNNLLKNAPHTAMAVAREKWDHAYSREQAVFPTAWVRENKFWPSVARIDSVYGERNLVCSCPPIEIYS